MRHPAGESLAQAAVVGQQFLVEGHNGRHGFFLRFAAVAKLVFFAGVVHDAGESHIRFREERGELVKVLLFPAVAKLIVVALHAVEADAEEGACHAGGEFDFIGAISVVIGIDGDRDEIGLRLGGPGAFGGDEVLDEVVVRSVLSELVAQPVHHAAAAVDDERTILHSDVGAGEALGKVVTVAAVLEGARDPPVDAIVLWLSFEGANLLQRRNRSRQRKREASGDREIVGPGSRGELLFVPALLHGRVHALHDAAELGVGVAGGIEIAHRRRGRRLENFSDDHAGPDEAEQKEQQIAIPEAQSWLVDHGPLGLGWRWRKRRRLHSSY